MQVGPHGRRTGVVDGRTFVQLGFFRFKCAKIRVFTCICNELLRWSVFFYIFSAISNNLDGFTPRAMAIFSRILIDILRLPFSMSLKYRKVILAF